MTNRALFTITLSSLALAAGAALADEETYDFSGFNSVSVSSGVTAEITAGSDYSVRAEGSAKSLERLDVRVSGSELRISRKRSFITFHDDNDVTVYVSLPALSALDVSSGAEATATNIAADNFSVDASSGSHAEISGSCKSLSVDVSSGAQVEADEFECQSANADASSGAHADIFTSESVSADASSGGSIRVYGQPKSVSSDSSSGGSVRIVK